MSKINCHYKRKVESFLDEWFKTHDVVYPSDVVEALDIPYFTANLILDELESEGKLQSWKVSYKSLGKMKRMNSLK
jgi:hypothetical protein